MSEGRGERECRGELVARERRGELSPADRLALGAHIESCATCRMTREIHADFEAETAVEVDDAVRIARLSAAARRWSQRRARPRARTAGREGRVRGFTLGLVALLLLASSASATAWWRRADIRAAIAAVAARTTPAPAVAHPRASASGSRHVEPPAPAVAVAAVTEVPPEAPPPPAEVRRSRAHARPAAPVPRETAASLLRLADEARRRGEIDQAFTLYRRLQSELPDTREAILSTVPLGGLLLRRAEAARAVAQFDRYLDAQPRGNLVPEALYGRGRALAAVGQRDGERQTWRRLLEQFPGSAYEPHARRRLDELK